MKSKSILTFAFVFFSLMQCQTTIAQLRNPITYSVVRQNSTDIFCETNWMAKKSTPTLVCKLKIVVSGDVVSPTFDISTTNNESIVKIARSLTDGRKKMYATYTLSNKEKITLDTFGYDSTTEGLKGTKDMGALSFFSIFVRNGLLSPATVAKFRIYDIETINIGTGVIEVKNTLGINTASIINDICKKLIESGVNAATLGGQIQQLGNVDSSIKKFFPIYGVTIGKTTLQELEANGIKINSAAGGKYVEINKMVMYDQKNSNNINTIYVYRDRNLRNLPVKWSELGFSHLNSYDKWLDIFKSLGYSVKITIQPSVKKFNDKDYLDAQFYATSTDEKLEFQLNFSYGDDGAMTSSPNSLNYMIIRYKY